MSRCWFRYFNRRLYPLVKAVRTVNRWRGHDRVAGAAGTDFQLPPRPLNRLLEEIFAGEAQVLGQTMRGERRAYSRGVSLMAVLRRTAGRSEIRSKPAGIAADLFDPVRRLAATRSLRSGSAGVAPTARSGAT